MDKITQSTTRSLHFQQPCQVSHPCVYPTLLYSTYKIHVILNPLLSQMRISQTNLPSFRHSDYFHHHHLSRSKHPHSLHCLCHWPCSTYSSMALFHMMTYPDKTKDSMLTMCVFPRSVPTYSHLLWKGRWQNVILGKRKQKEKGC